MHLLKSFQMVPSPRDTDWPPQQMQSDRKGIVLHISIKIVCVRRHPTPDPKAADLCPLLESGRGLFKRIFAGLTLNMRQAAAPMAPVPSTPTVLLLSSNPTRPDSV